MHLFSEGFPQVQVAFTAISTQRTCSSAILGLSRVKSQKGSEATNILTPSVIRQKYQRKKQDKERTGDKRKKSSRKSLITSETSAGYSSPLSTPVLNSVRNGTVAKIITNSTEVDGTSTINLVYVTLDCSPEILVPLTLPPYVQQQITNHARSSPVSHLNIGQQVQVRITGVDTMTEQIISCALVDAPPTSSRRRQGKETKTQRNASTFQRKSLEEMVPYLGKMVSGRVVSTTPYGAFLDIGCKNRNAILHKSRITRTSRVDNVTDFIDVGQTLVVRLIEVDLEKGNMAVSLLNEKSEQYMKWRKQHYEIRQFRQAARIAAARAAAAMFEETHEETDDIATALLLQMDKEEEEDRSHEKEEVLHGQWIPA